ncbi:phage tail spike protein [Bacillus cereus]|uniref:phage tail spike protein n=1 Tax=Bacillus cereus TaxID=1396 RepID=UPI00240644D7|nr:phage tail spike protein [Bacillus cereus]MDF9540347.1 phage tail spike protein [Bacillus cereus]MDF9583470.1 phage tail spike protein [Bacillus cereus]MDF9583538.1 phage tail spike protein [Bacillus cereus]MDG1590337.1 phage tail spike protein [Bacillus cereus]
MRTPSGDLHVVDFKTNQIVSDIQPKDYWDDKRHWEIKNNIDTLEFRVFENTDHATTLVQQNLVLKEVRGGRIVPYVITETEKDSKDRSLMVYASGEWIQLAKAGIIEPQKLESKTLKQCMEIALKGTKWTIGKTEHDGAHSMVIEEFTDPLDLLKKIAASFELELQYRAEVVGSKIVGRYVDMVQKRGRDTRKEVTFGKDLIGIKRIENSQSTCTALLGFVKKENGEFITISSINKGVPYLVDDAAYQRWNENGKHKFAFYTPQTDDQNMSPERLLTLMKTEMSKLVNASVSYGVDAQNIARIPGLSHEEINEGDTIRIIDEGFTPKLYLEARAIAGDESFKDPTQDNYVFGDYREIIDQNDELRRLYQKILGSLYDKVPQELFDQLNNKVKEQNKDIIDAKDKADQAQKESQTAKDLVETTQKYIEQNMVDIIEQPTVPTENLRDGKTLWIDSSDPANKVQKLWKGGQWERITPDTGPLKQSIKDVKEDIEAAKTELNQKVQSVEGKAQEIAGQIVGVQKQVNGKVDQTWIDNQLKDKADKSGVYTKDEIKNGFIGKQIYETDKQGNVQKFKDINTSIGQTNEALTQKAEKSELTKTNDGLTKLQNKTNEIETTANGTKQKLSELETTVNNTNVGGRNYVLDSDKFISPPNTVQNFRFVNDLKDLQGKQVTLSVYVEIKNAKTGVNPSNRIGFEPSIRYSDNSIQHLGAWLRITDGMNFKGAISTTLWIKDIEILKTEQNAVYIQCGGDYVKVGRPKIEIGNKVTDWTPASEDQVTTTDFTKKTVEIETTIKGINTSVSNVQNEQGKLTERMTKSEQTADGFKNSIESLTKKSSETTNKINTLESNVTGNKKVISEVQESVANINDDVRNLLIGSKSFDGALTFAQANNRWWLKSADKVKISKDIFQGNAVAETQSSWTALAYNFKDLVDRKVVKVGDKVTYSIYTRVKGLPDGQDLQQTFYFAAGATGIRPNKSTNQWQRVSVSFIVTAGMMVSQGTDNESHFRIEPDANPPVGCWYQQSSPLLTIGSKEYSWRPAPEDISDGNVLTKITTEIKEEAGKISEKLTSVEKKFDEQEIGVRNLVSDTKYWETTQLASNSAYGVFKNNLNSLFSTLVEQTVTFSFDVKITTTDKTAGRVQFYGENGSPKYTFVRQIFTGITDEFQRVTYTTKITEQPNNTGQARLEFWGIDAKTTKIIIQNFKLEKGNKATGWTPAPEEQVTTDEFTKKTTDIEKSVDGVKTTVTNVQKDQGTMQSTLNKVEQTTNSNSQSIISLSQTQGKQGEIIQQNTSDITQLNNQIKSKVTDTQMQEYVGGLGSTNLLFNAAFEDRVINATTGVVTNRNPSTTKWSVVGTGSGITIVPESARHHEGYNSVKITATGQTASKWSGIMQRVPAAQNGGDYVFSAWVYVQDKNTLDNGGAIKLQFFNGANAVSTFVQTEFKDLLVNNSWILVSVKITSPNVAITHLQGDIWVRQNGTIWVSQPQLQQGSTRSTFMENPKDYANYDQLVGEIGKKVATSDFNSKVSTIETSINQQSNRIDLKAEKNDVYNKIDSDGRYGSKAIVESHTSQLSVMSNEINSTVKKGNIISSINQTAEQIQVQANKINLVGYVTAEHLKGDVLEGMNIRTSRQSNDPRWVEIMKSNVRLKEDGLVRSYWGFYTRNDGGVQPSLFLGKDSTDTVGSIAITQVTPNKTDFANAWGTIGMVNEISNNMFKTNATVGFFRDSGGRLELSAGGHVLIDSKGLINVRSDDFLLLRAKRTMRLETTWDNGGTNINMEATKSFNVMAHSQIWLASNEEHFYDNNAGKFYFRNRNKPSDQNSVLIDDDNANADIRLAYIRVRASHVSGYQNSLQVKNYNGTEFRDLECRSLTVNGNFYNKSTKNIKANIRDLPFDPVEKIMALQPRSYNLKTEVEKLYKMREGKEEGEEPFTTKDIVANYGFIAEETDEIFKSEDGKAVNIYGTLAIHIAATQKMHIELKEVKEENKQLKEQVSMLINEVSTLKDLVRKLIDEKPEQP